MTSFSRFSCFPLLLGAAASFLLVNCSQSQDPYPLFFLTESRGSEEGSRFLAKYGSRYYTRVPMLSLDHFERFRSFLNSDGSYGVELFVKPEYRSRLYTETMSSQGLHMLPVMDGMAFAPMKIDKPIEDGELVIWGGLNGYDLKQISRTLKPINPELEEKRYKDEDPRPRPKAPKPGKKKKNEPVRDLNDRVFTEIQGIR